MRLLKSGSARRRALLLVMTLVGSTASSCIVVQTVVAQPPTQDGVDESDASILTIEQIAALPRRIRSCEFEYSVMDGAMKKLAVEDDKFYFESDRPFDGQIYRTRRGFNGEIAWSVDPPRSFNTRILPRVPAQVEAHPLTAPYLWVWGDPDERVWSGLQKKEAWDAVRQRMTYVGTRLVREQTCDVFSVDYPERNMKYEVAFSRELDGFPIQRTFELNGREFNRLDILEVHRDERDAIIAIRSQAQKPGEDPVIYHVVDVDSIKVNQPLDPALFEPPQ